MEASHWLLLGVDGAVVIIGAGLLAADVETNWENVSCGVEVS